MVQKDISNTLDTTSILRENNSRKRVKLVVSKAGDFREVRCPKCGVLLYKELIKSDPVNRVIQIKCRSCGALVTT